MKSINKTNPTMVAATIGLLGVAALGTPIAAHADTLDANQNTVDTNQNTVQPNQNTVETTQAPTQAQVDQAKADLDLAETNVGVAKNQEVQANKNYDEANDKYNQASNVLGVDDTQTAKQDVDVASQEVKTAQEGVTVAEQALTDAQTAQNAQAAVVEAAQEHVAQAQAQQTTAANAVQTAQANVDGTSEASVQENIDTAQKEVTSANIAVAAAQEKVDTAKKVDQQTDKLREDATANVTAKEQALGEASQRLVASNNNVAQATTKLDKVKSDAPADKIVFPQEMPMTPEFTAALKKLVDSNYQDKADYFAALDAQSHFERLKADESFKKANEIVTVDQIRDEANLYFAQLVNSIHRQLGDGKTLYMNRKEIDFADDIVKNLSKAKAYGLNHVPEQINAAAVANNFKPYPVNTYESAYFTEMNDVPLTRGEVMLNVANAVSLFVLYDSDSGFGHTSHILSHDTLGLSILNDKIDKSRWPEDDSIFTEKPTWRAFDIHVVGTDVSQMEGVNGYRGTLKEIRAKKAADKAKWESLYGATSEYNLKPTAEADNNKTYLLALKTAQAELRAAEAQQAQAQSDKVNAQNQLDQAKAELAAIPESDTPAAQEALQTALIRKKVAEEKLATAQQALKDLKASTADKLKNLAKAEADLKTAIDATETANKELVSETEKLTALQTATGLAKADFETAKADLEAAHDALDKATAHYKAVVNYDDNLAKAKTNLTKARDALAVAKAKYLDAVAHRDATKIVYDKLKAMYDAAKPVETPTKPVETPTKPVETPTKPVETPTKPVETPTEPVETPTKPVETPTKPVETPTKPVETPTKPVETPTKPVETPTKPVETPTKPVETPAKPVETPTKPVETQAKPVETPTKPVETPAKPVATSTRPATTKSATQVAHEQALPNTGSAESAMTVVGTVLTALGLASLKRKKN